MFGIVLGPSAALLIEGVPRAPVEAWAWAFAAGGLSLVGNGLFFVSARMVEMAILAPIIASAGGLSACIAIFVGAPWSHVTVAGGAILTLGVILSALSPRTRNRRSSRALGVLVAAVSAVALAGSYVAIGRAETEIGSAWAYVALMLMTFLLWTAPTLMRWQDLSLLQSGPRVLLAEASGVCVFVFLGKAAAENPVLAGLVYSQYAVIAAAVGYSLWNERPLKRNWLGALLAVGGTMILLAR